MQFLYMVVMDYMNAAHSARTAYLTMASWIMAGPKKLTLLCNLCPCDKHAEDILQCADHKTIRGAYHHREFDIFKQLLHLFRQALHIGLGMVFIVPDCLETCSWFLLHLEQGSRGFCAVHAHRIERALTLAEQQNSRQQNTPRETRTQSRQQNTPRETRTQSRQQNTPRETRTQSRQQKQKAASRNRSLTSPQLSPLALHPARLASR